MMKYGRFRVIHYGNVLLDYGTYHDCLKLVSEVSGEQTARLVVDGASIDGWEIEARSKKDPQEAEELKRRANIVAEAYPCVADYHPRIEILLEEFGWTREDYWDAFHHPMRLFDE